MSTFTKQIKVENVLAHVIFRIVALLNEIIFGIGQQDLTNLMCYQLGELAEENRRERIKNSILFLSEERETLQSYKK